MFELQILELKKWLKRGREDSGWLKAKRLCVFETNEEGC
jgi:hypothetical protein